eukprot:NODE_1945_length_1243_cov_7.137353_g1613_i0.p1 GENE.NODE_1945_length_1243_cov_7.137353_g1613_i0~~NODE_1945_length_1243_cov_7.137353_g1613_i0.p1  ORF type:complete len:384 (-),score=59.37 NODE_1945_length_1243_cov_7.137353_g1613_i0:91-1143(-)
MTDHRSATVLFEALTQCLNHKHPRLATYLFYRMTRHASPVHIRDTTPQAAKLAQNLVAYVCAFAVAVIGQRAGCELMSTAVERAVELLKPDEQKSAVSQGLGIGVYEGDKNAPAFDFILGHLGGDPNTKDEKGNPILCVAGTNGQAALVRSILKHKPDLKAVNTDKRHALYVACMNGHVDAVRAFLEHGFDVNLKTHIGASPIYCAAYYGHLEVMDVLAEYNADIHEPNALQMSPTYIVCQNGQLPALKWLVQRGGRLSDKSEQNIDCVSAALIHCHFDCARYAFSRGGPIDVSTCISFLRDEEPRPVLAQFIEEMGVTQETKAEVLRMWRQSELLCRQKIKEACPSAFD